MRDGDCLATGEALLVDGANGVCRDLRLDAPSGHVGHLAALVLAALIVAGWLSASRVATRARRAVVVAIGVLAAIPGAHALLVLRADRPTERAETARASTALHDRIRDFAQRNGCARVEIEGCPECMPAARLALAGLRCDAPVRVELREGALDARCDERAGTLVCGRAR